MRPLRLGRRHALHAVHAALVLQLAVGAAPFDRRDDFLDAADIALARRHHLDAPALHLGELPVHAEELVGEQRGFLAAGAGANLQHDVLLIVGILRNEQNLDFGQQRVAPLFEAAQLFLGELAHVGVAALDELFGLLDFARAPICIRAPSATSGSISASALACLRYSFESDWTDGVARSAVSSS